MTSPCPGYPVSTPYGVFGPHWSTGWHDGVDYAAPTGAAVVAAWSGEVVEAAYPTSFGSAFGRAVVVAHDDLPDGSAGYWGLYAHLDSERVTVGERVTAGAPLGTVGATGNVTGAHLHYGVYTRPAWSSGGGIDPQPWVDADPVATVEDPDMTPEQDQLLRDVYNFCFAYRQRDQIGPAPLGQWLEDTRIILGQVHDMLTRADT